MPENLGIARVFGLRVFVDNDEGGTRVFRSNHESLWDLIEFESVVDSFGTSGG